MALGVAGWGWEWGFVALRYTALQGSMLWLSLEHERHCGPVEVTPSYAFVVSIEFTVCERTGDRSPDGLSAKQGGPLDFDFVLLFSFSTVTCVQLPGITLCDEKWYLSSRSRPS